jgi:hypothetical protein
LLPPLVEDAGFDPFLEAVMSGGPGTELGGIQRLPLAARAEDKEDGMGTDAVGGTWLAAAKGMGVDMLREEDLQEFPEFIGDAPIVGDRGRIHDQSSCVMVKQLQEL